MESVSPVSDSLARLRDAVTQIRRRVDRRERRHDDAPLLSEPIVAGADSPIERRRAKQLDALRQAHIELARKVGELEERANGEALGVLEYLSGLEGRIKKVAGQNRASVIADAATRASVAQQARAQRALETMQAIHAAVNVVSTLQSTAYGQRGSVLSTNNLLLAGNQLLWSYIDPIAKRLGIPLGPSPSALAYWAPLLSLATAWVVLGDRQHVRFISGITVFDTPERRRFEGLRSRIAGRLWPEFQKRADVPVTAQPISPFRDVFVFAHVDRGTLRLEAVPRDGGRPLGLRVAWIVDTGEDVG